MRSRLRPRVCFAVAPADDIGAHIISDGDASADYGQDAEPIPFHFSPANHCSPDHSSADARAFPDPHPLANIRAFSAAYARANHHVADAGAHPSAHTAA